MAQNQPQVLPPAAGPNDLVSDLLRVSDPDTYDHGDLKILLRVCGDILLDLTASKNLVHHTINCLTTHVKHASNETLESWRQIFNKLIVSVRRLSQVDEDSAIKSMKIFDEMVRHEDLGLIDPHVVNLVKFCLEFIKKGRRHHGARLISKAFSLLASVMSYRWRETMKEAMKEAKLIDPMIRTLLPYMCEERQTNEENESLKDLASQVVWKMWFIFPLEELIPVIIKHTAPALENPSPSVRCGAYMMLSVTCNFIFRENRTLSTEYLGRFLFPRVYSGLIDTSVNVCQSALMTLGKFAENLQPNIAAHLSTGLKPALGICLRRISQATTLSSKDSRRTCKAIILLCKNLDKEIFHYLEDLLCFVLGEIVSSSSSDEVKKLCMEAVESIAASAGTDLGSWLPKIKRSLYRFLIPTVDKAEQKMQSRAFHCLTALATHVGEPFRLLAVNIVTQGLGVMKSNENPDVCVRLYQLFSKLSAVMKAEMEPYLVAIIPSMINSVKLGKDTDTSQYRSEMECACLCIGKIARNVNETFLPYLNESYKEILPLLDHRASSVRSSSAKSVANLCCSIWSLLKEGGGDKQQLGQELSEMLRYVVPKYLLMIRNDKTFSVCREVLNCITNMLRVMGSSFTKYAVHSSSGSGVNADYGGGDAGENGERAGNGNVEGDGNGNAEEDDDENGVGDGNGNREGDNNGNDEDVNGNGVGDGNGNGVGDGNGNDEGDGNGNREGDDNGNGYGNGDRDGVGDPTILLDVLKDVLNEEMFCWEYVDSNDPDNEVGDNLGPGDAIDGMLATLAGTIDGEKFSEFFMFYMVIDYPEFQVRQVGWGNNSFIYDNMDFYAPILKSMGEAAAGLVDIFYTMFLELLEYDEARIRRDAVNALGELIGEGGLACLSKYNNTLQIFNNLLNTETDEKIIDTIYASICRLITSNHTAVPMDDYLPIIISRLPLQCDYHSTNQAVWECMLGLYKSSCLPQCDNLLLKLIKIAGQLLLENNFRQNCRQFLIQFLREVHVKDQEVVELALEESDMGIRRSIKACLPTET